MIKSNPETADPSTIAEMEETIARISSHKGIEGVVIMNRRGVVLRSTLDDEQTKNHAGALADLAVRAAGVAGMLDQDDELTFLRVRSKQREIMISPDREFLLVVLQNLNPSD